MKSEDAYAYNHAKVGDSFLSFRKVDDKVEACDYKVSEVRVSTLILDNGIMINRTTGKVVGLTNSTRAHLPSYFPSTPANKRRAKLT